MRTHRRRFRLLSRRYPLDKLTELAAVDAGGTGSDDAQRAPEGATALRHREASKVRMQMSSPTRLSASGIGHQPKTGLVLNHDDA